MPTKIPSVSAARLLFAAALALPCCGARAVDVRVAAQEVMAPKWIQQHGRVSGICPDVMAAIERIEPRLHFTGLDTSRSLPGIEAGLQSGSLDGAAASVSRATESGAPSGPFLVSRTGDAG